VGENQKEALITRVRLLLDDIAVSAERISIYKNIKMDEKLKEEAVKQCRTEVIVKKKEIIQILETNL
jgi:hypothetical protein